MDNKQKFTNKADIYAKYRPSYPLSFFQYLFENVGIKPGSYVADIGAGTGILTRLLLEQRLHVYAVEPNPEMRSKCVEFCRDYPKCSIIAGSAEETILPDKSVDLITVAQAFHWFDVNKTKIEFQRIIKEDGKVCLIWNRRDENDTFIKEYEQLVSSYCKDYRGIAGGLHNDDELFANFFKDGIYQIRSFDNSFYNTLESFIGGAMSASYAPRRDTTEYEKYADALTQLFEKHKDMQNLVQYKLATVSYVGNI